MTVYRYVGPRADPPEESPAPAEGEQPSDRPWRAPPAHIPGVPLAEMTEEEYKALPDHLQKAVAASPLYQAAGPPKQAEGTAATSSRRPKAGGEE